jgi:hypothetical protein
MFIPVIDTLVDIADKTFTGDALLTQRKLALYIVEDRQAHYVFTAKDNQPTLAQDIRLAFENRQAPDYSEPYTLAHGRIESRSIWTSTLLNNYLIFLLSGKYLPYNATPSTKKAAKKPTRLLMA